MKRFIFCLLFFPLLSLAQFSQQEMQQFVIKNILPNNGFETNLAGWIGDSGLTLETTTSNISSGNAAASFDSTTANHQVYRASNITIPAGLYGHNGVFSCNLKCASGTCTHVLEVNGGGGTLVSQSITSSLTYARTSANFIFPSSGTINVAVRAVASNEPQLYIDDCYLSDATNIYSVSQAQFVGSAYIEATASCSWTRTNTALGAFGTDTDCPGPTVESNPGPGTIQTTDADLPQFTVNNLGPGSYLVLIDGQFQAGAASQQGVAIYDGTTQSGHAGFQSNTTTGENVSMSAVFTYDSTASRTFAVHGSASTGSIDLSNTNSSTGRLYFRIFKFPSTSDIAYRADTINLGGSLTYATAASCTWITTSGTYANFSADTDCATPTTTGSVTAPGTKIPGIASAPLVPGRYLVTATGSFRANYATTSTDCHWRISDGTNSGGNAEAYATVGTGGQYIAGIWYVFTYSTTQSAKTFQVQGSRASGGGDCRVENQSTNQAFTMNIIPLVQNFPMPNIVNAVTTNSSGVTKELYAVLNCDAGSSITSQSGTTSEGVATIGNISSGVCAGTFAGMWSGTPVCNADIKGSTLDSNARIDATSSTAFSLYCITPSTGAAAASCDVGVFCTGPK